MLRVVRVLVLVGALCLVVLGLLAGGLGLFFGTLEPGGDVLSNVVVVASFLALAVGLGLTLAWHAWRAILGRASAPFRPRWPWVLALLFVLVLIVGQAILLLDLLPAVTFPPFHVLVAALPPLIVVLLLGRILGQVGRWREIVLQISSGALLSTLLAFALEAVFVLGLLLAAFMAVALQPGGVDLLRALSNHLQDATWLQDPAALSLLLRSPLVPAAAFLVAAVAIPLIEESVKTVGVGLFAYRRPTLSEAFLWGVAGGAGFALAEGMLNSAGALGAWAPAILLRAGATLLHCITGGLMGLAWYHLLAGRHWKRALGLYVLSVSLHGLWNAVTVAMSLVSLSMVDGGGNELVAGLGLVVALGILTMLMLASALGLLALARHIRGRDAACQEAMDRPAAPPGYLLLPEHEALPPAVDCDPC
jgi:hypothetical protein